MNERITYHNQREIGYIGLALLRQWLIGESENIEKLFAELLNLYKTGNKIEKSLAISEGARDGYDKWSEIYDVMPNILIDAEQPVVERMLEGINGKKAIDVACGTGRCSSLMEDAGFDVVGVDQSKEMLEQARKKNPNIDFHQIDVDLENLPFKNEGFDLATSSLAFTHFKDINNPIKKIYDVLKPGGYFILSDIHPWIVELGGQADYQDEDGNIHFVRNYVHLHSEYIRAFNSVGFKIVDCVEPVITEDHLEKISDGFAISQDALNAALKGLPLALVWKLKKE